MRARRGNKKVSSDDIDEYLEGEGSERENAPVRKGRRPGKAPAREDYGEEREEQDHKPKKSRPGRPSSKHKGHMSTTEAGNGPEVHRVKQEPRQPQRPAQQRVGAGAPAVSRQELLAMHEKMTEYKRHADINYARFKGSISRQEVDNLVRLVMRHMLFMNTEKPGCPVSRAELTKLVSDSSIQKKHNIASMVIAMAQHKMLHVFGLELREITKAPHRGARKGMPGLSEGTKHFVVRSIVPPSLMAEVVQDRAEDAVRGFAAVLLSLIELSGGKVTAAELWPLLEELGLEEQGHHPRFGKPADLLEALARRRYVNVERQQGPDGEIKIYSIAENAVDELGRDNLKDFYEEEFAREERGSAAA